MKKEMLKAAENLQFEQSISLREKISKIQEMANLN
jgi:excinuclease UvrABC helicase subunit UvrB